MKRADPADIWWLRPSWITVLWIAVLVASLLTPAEAYMEIARTRKYIDLDTFVVLLLGLLSFWLGCFLFEKRRNLPRNLDAYVWLAESNTVVGIAVVLIVGTVAAYALWLGPAINPGTLSAILTAEYGSEYGRKVTTQVPGITTLTQLGMPLAVIIALRLVRGPGRQWLAWLGVLALLLLLTALRALIWSERVAMLEVAIPVAATALLFGYRGQRWVPYVPVVAIAGLIVIFGLFEYVRSWSFFSEWGQDYVSFTLGRFFSYYSTSFNNGAAYLQLVRPDYVPVNLLRFVFEFPNPFSGDLRQYAADYEDGLATFFTNNLNPEFNLLSGPGAVMADVGPYLGCVALFVLGAIAGALYASYIRVGLAGLILYPVWLVGLLDFGRTLYWPQGPRRAGGAGADRAAHFFQERAGRPAERQRAHRRPSPIHARRRGRHKARGGLRAAARGGTASRNAAARRRPSRAASPGPAWRWPRRRRERSPPPPRGPSRRSRRFPAARPPPTR